MVGTRQSQLAFWQAQFVGESLRNAHSDLDVELVGIRTKADQTHKTPLSTEGGKGLFLKELEEALLRDQIDIAVHSMKDVPVTLPAGLHIPVICERGDPRDVLISHSVLNLSQLSKNSKVGTSSMRRQCLILRLAPDASIVPIRGNVQRRLEQLDQGKFDALILAAAGLRRLGLEDRIGEVLCGQDMLPAVGQGAIGIECRIDNEAVNQIIQPLNHLPTEIRLRAERAASSTLNSNCHSPVAVYAELGDGQLHLRGMVGAPDGKEVLFVEERGSEKYPESVGEKAAEALRGLGAERILSRAQIS